MNQQTNKMNQPIDLTQDKESATNADLKAISDKTDDAANIMASIGRYERITEGLKDDLATILDHDLPNMMRECGMENFTTSSGFAVGIKAFSNASLPSAGAIDKATGEAREELTDRLAEGLKFITENGGGSIIKSAAEIDIGKDPALREGVVALLEGYGGLNFQISDKVHPGSLNSWIREKTANGDNIPVDTFKVFNGEKAVIKLPK
jgi:hypothetical protein